MEFQASVIRQTALSEEERVVLFQLYRQYYDNVFEDIFQNDLIEKDWIIIIRDGRGKLQGFSTIQLIWLKVRDTDHLYLFSGDTIIREEARNTHSLSGAFIHFMYALIENHPGTPIHWFLITKGYRTYRFLPVYFREYYPVFDKTVPAHFQEVLDAVAFHKFGNQYNPQTHIIHYNSKKDHLKPEFSLITEGRFKDPAIRFFYTKNPFFNQGDELACITDISENNFQPMVERVWKCTTVNFKWEKL